VLPTSSNVQLILKVECKREPYATMEKVKGVLSERFIAVEARCSKRKHRSSVQPIHGKMRSLLTFF
jgi:hypothetical protein